MSKKMQIYHGTLPKPTHDVIKQVAPSHGVCLNIFKGYSAIAKKFNYLEELGLKVFMDNGSFERFNLFLNGKMSESEYFNIDFAEAYFRQVTQEYETLLRNSRKPHKIILTVPEIIGNSQLSIKLQLRFLPYYRRIESEYGCKILVAMQFNSKDEKWLDQAINSADFIATATPRTWRVGLPFGNDFKSIQNKESMDLIDKLFRTTLVGRGCHLFGCLAMGKVKKFAIPYQWIVSIDGSSINNWSRNGHYLSESTERLLDVRVLKRKIGSKDRQDKALAIMESEGIPFESWNEMNFIEKYEQMLRTYIKIFDGKFDIYF